MLRHLCVVAFIVLTAGPLAAQQDKAAAPVAVSPDGSRAARGEDKLITVFDPQTNKILAKMQSHTDKVTALAFAPDGRTLVSGGLDKIVNVFDAQQGFVTLRITVENAVVSVGFSTDGKVIIARDADQMIHEFDSTTGKVLRKYKDDKK